MDQTRRTLRSILLEQKMDQAFIVTKAGDEGLNVANVSQEGLRIMVHLKAPGDEKAIRRFKNQLRMRNPRLERIEVRQPDGRRGGEDDEEDSQQPMKYADWLRKLLIRFKKAATEHGWNFYTDPKAGKDTDYFVFIRGEGPDREAVKIRTSTHPTSAERPDLSFDMTGQENAFADLVQRLQQKAKQRDEYPLI